MFKTAIAIAALLACSMPVFAANDYPSAKMHTALPSEALTVTDWYKQNVYDPTRTRSVISKMFWSISPGRSWRSSSASAASWAQEKRTLQCRSRLCIRP